MKLFYDKKAKDPTYYAQQGIRNVKRRPLTMSETLESIQNSSRSLTILSPIKGKADYPPSQK